MARKKKSSKYRAEFRKKHDDAVRRRDFTRAGDPDAHENLARNERVSGKGDLSRRRTILGEAAESGQSGYQVLLDVDESTCVPGRVLGVRGLTTLVETREGVLECVVRGLLRNLATDLQHVVVAGDRVMVRPEDGRTGMIVRVEPRHGVINRTSRGRRQVLVANVDQALIVCSAAEPVLKPGLVDRYLVATAHSGIPAIIVINKIDLVEPGDLQPVIGVWSRLGHRVVMVSAKTGAGIEVLRWIVQGRESVVTGQSGAGKSSLLNAMDPNLALRTSHVSQESEKGRHTTTSAVLVPLAGGGHIVDTPGIRQFQLWDVVREELEGLFRDIRPFINGCRFPDCSHRHEESCAVKSAVADGMIDVRRYESYLNLYEESARGT